MTTLRFTWRAAIVALATLCAVAGARAEPPYGPDVYVDEPDYDREFLLGIGYSRVSFSGAENPLDDYDAVHFDPVLSFAPLPALSPLRLGASVGLTFSLEDVGGSVSSGGGGAVVVGDGDTSLILFQPEIALSWRQPLGDEDVGFFIEPGVCGGGTFAFFDVDDEAFEEAGGTGDPDEWDSTFHARAFLRAGLRVTGGLAGLEASYLRGGNIDLGDDTGGDIEQWYVGIFGALKF